MLFRSYLDTENAMNPEFAQQLGVDLNKLTYVQPGTIEEVGETIEKIVLMSRTSFAYRVLRDRVSSRSK